MGRLLLGSRYCTEASGGGIGVWELLERYEVRRLASRRAARPGSLPRPGVVAGTDLLPQIRHVVVLMMENHSYDNYLGMLQDRGEGFQLASDGVPDVYNYGPAARPSARFTSPRPSSARECRRRAGTPATCSGVRVNATAS